MWPFSRKKKNVVPAEVDKDTLKTEENKIDQNNDSSCTVKEKANSTSCKKQTAKKDTAASIKEETNKTTTTHEQKDATLVEDTPSTTEKKARTPKYRVIYNQEDKCWDIKKDGAKRVIRKVKTKAEALDIVEHLAEKQNLSVTVHKKDGKFQKRA